MFLKIEVLYYEQLDRNRAFFSMFSLSHFKSSDYGIMLKVQLKIVKLYARTLCCLSCPLLSSIR